LDLATGDGRIIFISYLLPSKVKQYLCALVHREMDNQLIRNRENLRTPIFLLPSTPALAAVFMDLRPMPAYAVWRIDTCNANGIYFSPLAGKVSSL